MSYEKKNPIYSKHPEFENGGGMLLVERQGSRPKYYCFACQKCGFKFTRKIKYGLFCPSCASLNVGVDVRIRL